LNNIRGILSDIDGTLYFKGKPVKGAIETIEKLREFEIALLFFTNTDSKSPKTILKMLQDFGFTINEEEIYTPIIALKEFLSKLPDKKLFLVTSKEVEREFQRFPLVYGDEIPNFKDFL